MITIKFTDADTELEALGFLLGRFPGRALKTGEVLVPDAALQALALEGYQFTVIGKLGSRSRTPTVMSYSSVVQCTHGEIWVSIKCREDNFFITFPPVRHSNRSCAKDSG